MDQMKKSKKNRKKPVKDNFSPKGQKLSYEHLRVILMNTFEHDREHTWTARQLIKKLKIANSKPDVVKALDSLVKQKKISASGEGFYALTLAASTTLETVKSAKTSRKNVLTGRVDMTRSGSAYVIVDDMDQDVYVSSRNLGTAMNRDRVEVEIFSQKRGRKPEGKVVGIVKRSVEQVMGTLRRFKSFAVVVPDRASYGFDVIVPADKLGEAVDGDKVVVRITDWTKASPSGEILYILGASGSHELEMQSILIHNGFNLAFPEEVIDECRFLEESITQEEISRRRDFRKITTFTIDPITAKDFDDALSYRILENGNTEIGVHIADVSHYVKPGTALDKEAYLRSTSVYLVDRVCPMLPEKLSNELCSLRPNEESLCYSAVFEIDADNKIIDRWFGRTIIFSDHRFSYEEAQEVLETGEGPFASELKKLNRIAKALRKKRFRDGAITFETDELQFKVDEMGETLEIFVKERKDAHLLIEDFMLLANREVATFIARKGKTKEIPFPYRVHDVPDPDKLLDFQRFARELGFQMQFDTPRQISKSFNKLAEAAKKDERLRLLEPLAIRTMAKAVYTTNNIGHYGLAFEFYTHFTSPIRRYSDVLVHRILDRNLQEIYREDKEILETRCRHISERERAAMTAERESVKYKQLEYLQNRMGQDFNGVISGVIDSGIFVELDESRAEGLIPFRTMHGGFYMVAPFTAGSRTGDRLTIGQSVIVRIKRIDLGSRQMDLQLVGLPDNEMEIPLTEPKETVAPRKRARNSESRAKAASKKRTGRSRQRSGEKKS